MSEKTVRIGFIGTGLKGQWLLDIAADNSDVGIEVPAAINIEDCGALIEASKETGFRMMLEKYLILPGCHGDFEYRPQGNLRELNLPSVRLSA